MLHVNQSAKAANHAAFPFAHRPAIGILAAALFGALASPNSPVHAAEGIERSSAVTPCSPAATLR